MSYAEVCSYVTEEVGLIKVGERELRGSLTCPSKSLLSVDPSRQQMLQTDEPSRQKR